MYELTSEQASNILGVEDNEGVGSWFRNLNPAQRQNTVKAMTVAKNHGSKTSFARDVLSRSNKFLFAKQDILKADIKANLREGKYTATDKTLFHRVLLGTQFGGSLDIIKPSIIDTPGVCNFDKGQLPDGQIFVLERIGVRFAVEATSVTDPSLATYSTYETSLPASLKNAVLEVKIGDDPSIEIPVTEFQSVGDAITSNGIGYSDLRPLNNYRILQGGQKVTATLRAGTASAALTNNIFIEVALGGTVFKTA